MTAFLKTSFGKSAGKNNPDFAQPLMTFPYSIICYYADLKLTFGDRKLKMLEKSYKIGWCKIGVNSSNWLENKQNKAKLYCTPYMQVSI